MMNCKRLLVAGVLFTATALGQPTAFENVILKANKPYDKIVTAIQARGGRVTHQYAYINALAAELPSNALADIRATAGVISMAKDTIVNLPPVGKGLEIRGIGSGTSPEVLPDSIRMLSDADIGAASANASPAAYTVNNTLMGLDPLFAAGKQGNGVLVALIDSGIRPGFPHIGGTVIGGEDFVGDGLGFSNIANNGHGTFVSGMIAAHVAFLFSNTNPLVLALNLYAPGATVPFGGGTLVPMVGTAPAAKIYALRVFGPTGGAPTSRIMAAMDRVIQLRDLYNAGDPSGLNIRVCNMSLGGATVDPGLDPEDQLLDQLLAHDIVPVVAAGNAGPAALTVGSPASSASSLAVGAANLAHNERVLRDLQFGPGVGAFYRPFGGTLMAYFSSRGPDADGRVQPNVVANGFANFGMGLGTSTSSISIGSGTSFATPSVAGIAAVLRQAFPTATARQIRNAIISSANPTLVNAVDVLDQGRGYVNAIAASNLLAAGAAPDTVDPLPKANGSVQVNVEQNTSLKVVSGFVRQTLSLKPGERHEILYRVNPNTSQIVISLSNFAAGPAAQQNQLFGDDILFAVHSAKTSSIGEGDYPVLTFARNGTWVVNNPEPGLMRVSINGDWTNGGNVSVDASVVSLTDPIPQFTSQGQIVTTQLAVVPFTIPAGTATADFRLSWRADWGNYPTADIDLILVGPGSLVNLNGATLNNPETATIQNPPPGNWIALIDGFYVPAGSDKYEFRIALDGKVIH